MEPKHDNWQLDPGGWGFKAEAKLEAPRFYLYENKFEVPSVGTFELHLNEPKPYVQLVHPAETPLPERIFASFSSPDIASLSDKDLSAAGPTIQRPGGPGKSGPV